MTLIEFFGKDSVENICSSLTKTPDRVFLIGDRLKHMDKYADAYREVFAARGVDIDIICRSVNKNKMQTVLDALTSIVEEYDDCVFDLTGGEELYLTATGMIFERYRGRGIQMHRFNIRNNTVIDCDQDGKTILEAEAPELTVEENIRIYGGNIVYDEQKENATYRWDMNDEFRDDIDFMWKICRRDVRLWNTQIGVIGTADKLSGNRDELTVSVSVSALEKQLELNNAKYIHIRSIFDRLYKFGLLREYSVNDETFSVTFKNIQIKKCLTVAGKILEMKVFLAAVEATEKDGSQTYNDVMNGVFIDWDGRINEEQYGYDTENEIDVMMMHGMVPVFVSCKNGFISNEELYKLSTVASRFGGKYAKKILVATALDNSVNSNYIRQRAEDMGIRLIEGCSHNGKFRSFAEMDDDDMNRIIRTFWSN